MKRIGLVVVGMLAVPFVLMTYACDDGATGTGGAGASGTTKASTTGNTVTVTKASSSSGVADCTGLGEGFDPACGTCLETSCCAELAIDGGVGRDPDLIECAQTNCDAECFPPPTPPFPIECTVPTPNPSMGSCVTLGGGNACNPITQEGCTGAGASCDVGQNGFQCYADGNTHALCEGCGDGASDGLYCQPGMTCVAQCARYCCDDADCGMGTCTKTINGMAIFPTATGLGVCQEGAMTTTSSTTTASSSSTGASSSSTGP